MGSNYVQSLRLVGYVHIHTRRVSSDGSVVDFGLEDPELEPRWFQ